MNLTRIWFKSLPNLVILGRHALKGMHGMTPIFFIGIIIHVITMTVIMT